MNSIFHHVLDQFVVVFLDDILVYLQNLDDHVRHLQEVSPESLEIIIFMQNCLDVIFVKIDVKFLGHVITPNGVHADPKKVEAVSL